MDKRNMDNRKLLWLFKKHFDTHLITFESPLVFFNLLINNIFFLVNLKFALTLPLFRKLFLRIGNKYY